MIRLWRKSNGRVRKSRKWKRSKMMTRRTYPKRFSLELERILRMARFSRLSMKPIGSIIRVKMSGPHYQLTSSETSTVPMI